MFSLFIRGVSGVKYHINQFQYTLGVGTDRGFLQIAVFVVVVFGGDDLRLASLKDRRSFFPLLFCIIVASD